ncbi:MAG: ferritin-like domain-containing protein, partial [Solirubrobacteraceae bacterium]
MSREAFLMRSTLAAGAAYGALSATGLISSALAESGGGDVDILNYALTLEFLETEFYTLAAKRVKGLSSYESKLTKELR